MIQIRRNVFETNSSSSHSISIRSDALMKELGEDIYFTHDEMLDSLNLTKDGKFISYEKDWYFGRAPFRPIDTFALRFMYAYASFAYDDESRAELISLLKELVPECTSIAEPEWSGTDEPFLQSFMEKYNITLREFLTNKKYIVIQDGDEYCIWEDLIASGLIDINSLDNKDEVKSYAEY